jgi:methionyl-tRNA formyltransferase
MRKNILFCVSTEKGFSVLKAAHKNLNINIILSTFKEVNVAKSYDDEIQNFSLANNLPTYLWKSIDKNNIDWLQKNKIWAIVCVGWRYMIPKEWINFLKGRVIVTHDSLLPKYRGFAPLASALINGESKTGVTVLLAGNEVDSGDILYQKTISIEDNDTINDLIKKTIPLFTEGIIQSINNLSSRKTKKIEQKNSDATYSIWRDEDDLWIDWNESSKDINNKIRALGNPYLGARTRLNNEIVIIKKAQIADDVIFEIRQPGKVWKISDIGEPIIVCGKGMLKIIAATTNGKPLLPLKRLRSRFS